MNGEVWKPIVGYGDKYSISNLGRVRNDATGVVRKLADNGRGYVQIQLCHNNKSRSFYVHRLVADAFLSKREGQTVVNHIDGNKSNNCVENLEWCTPRHNEVHASVNNLRWSKLTPDDVNEIKRRRANGEIYKSIAKDYPVDRSHLAAIVRGEYWRLHE